MSGDKKKFFEVFASKLYSIEDCDVGLAGAMNLLEKFTRENPKIADKYDFKFIGMASPIEPDILKYYGQHKFEISCKLSDRKFNVQKKGLYDKYIEIDTYLENPNTKKLISSIKRRKEKKSLQDITKRNGPSTVSIYDLAWPSE